jgi:hypothetical protein
MGVRPTTKPLSPARRFLLWSIMAAAVFWTLVFQASQRDTTVPEFVYVNF